MTHLAARCPYCQRETQFMSSLEFYGTDYGSNVYVCKPCDAYVGTHGKTRKPLGTPANRTLRQLRKKCHSLFDVYWKKGKLTRSQAYKWLSFAMAVPKNQAHIGMFDEKQCNILIGLLEPISSEVFMDIK